MTSCFLATNNLTKLCGGKDRAKVANSATPHVEISRMNCMSLFPPYLTTFRLPGLYSVEWWQYQWIGEHRKTFGTTRRWLSPALAWSDWEKRQTPFVRLTDPLEPYFNVNGRQVLFISKHCAFRTHRVIIRYIYKTHVVGPCHHGTARPQVADRGTASDKEGSCEYNE